MEPEVKWQGKWILAEVGVTPKGQKTPRYNIKSKDGSFLGVVKWHGAWRCFAFFNAPDCLFEKTCLTELSGFLANCDKERVST